MRRERVPAAQTRQRRLSRWWAAALALLALGGTMRPGGPSWNDATDDPFRFLRPWLEVSAADRRRLEEGEVVVRILAGQHGQLVVFGAARLDAPPERLVAWTRAIADLKRSPFVLAIRRFSDPPVPDDLEEVRLDDRDLDAIRRCQPGDCGLKLGEHEIGALQRAVEPEDDDPQEAVQRAFRHLLLERVNQYRLQGLAGLPPYVNGGEPAHLQDAFAAILASSPYLSRGLPDLAAHLEGYPHRESPHIESFFYWSTEGYGAGKPVVTVTHVNILRSERGAGVPAVVVAGKQIFASHYMNGSLGLTMVLPGATDSGPHYLVYLNRSQLDVLGGVFGFLKRAILEGRVSRDTPSILRGLRDRLESGEPPGNP